MSQKNLLKASNNQFSSTLNINTDWYSELDKATLQSEKQEDLKKIKEEKNEFLESINTNVKEGLLEMINKGKIKKDVDLTSAFFGQG